MVKKDAKKDTNEYGCSPTGSEASCCKVVAIVTVDERGQMVLPKEIREKAKIAAGDKLVAISCEKGGEVCCISLLKADNLSEIVKGILGPLMADIQNTKKGDA